jgi:undecaprenyl-diphosphatase
MDIFQAIIYGIVQGVGEFLPISSTAHLKLLPWLFNWKDPGQAFDVALHLGTAAAVIIFFFNDWIKLIIAGFTNLKSSDGKLFWFIFIATIPGGIAGVLFSDLTDIFDRPLYIAISLIIMGILLYIADKYGKSEAKIEQIGITRSIIVGVSQVLAMIPGVSRSGITMTAGRSLGLTREAIARFTFLMSTPIILADGLYHIKGMGQVPDKFAFAVAIITAAIVGLLSIRFLLNYLKTKGFGIFVIYRFILGGFVIVMYFIRG